MNIFSFIKKNYIIIGILLLGAILRFYKLDFQSLWHDEIHTMNEANPILSLPEVHDKVKAHEQMPPLYFYVMNLLFKIFGYTSLVARMFSAIIGVLGIYAMYLLGKKMFNKRVGLIAAALISINYFQLYYSQEARPYIFLFLFTILAFYYLIRYIKVPTLKNAILYGIISCLMIYSHFFGLFILFSQYLILLGFFLLTEQKKKFFINSFVSVIITIILFIPAINIFIGISKIEKFHLPPPSIDIFTKFFKDFFGHSEFVLTMISLLIIFYFIKLSKEKDTPITYKSIVENKTVFSFVILAPWIVIGILIPLVRSYLVVPMLENRYFMALLPAIIVLLAIAISEFKNRIVQIGFVLIFIIFSFIDIDIVKKHYDRYHKEQWKEVSKFVIDNNKNDDVLVSRLSWHVSYFFRNGNDSTKVVNQRLEDYINEMMTDSTKVKSFWYIDGHHNGPYQYVLPDVYQDFMDDNFIEGNTINLYQAWAKHFVPISDELITINIDKYRATDTKNKDDVKFNVENFEVNPEKIIVSGWACLMQEDSTESMIEIVAIGNDKAYKIQHQKIKREDVTSYFKSKIDLSNSGFSVRIPIKNFPEGNYQLGIIIKNLKANKDELILTDKFFTK